LFIPFVRLVCYDVIVTYPQTPGNGEGTLRRFGSKRLRSVAAIVARCTGICVLALALLSAWLWMSTDLPSPERLRERAALGATRVLDRNGRLLYAVPDPLGAQRSHVSLGDISPALIQARLLSRTPASMPIRGSTCGALRVRSGSICGRVGSLLAAPRSRSNWRVRFCSIRRWRRSKRWSARRAR